AGIVLALVSPTTALELDMPVLGYLYPALAPPRDTAGSPGSGGSQPPGKVFRAGTLAPVRLQGAEGAVELASAMEFVQRQGGSASVEWSDPATGRTSGLTLTPPGSSRSRFATTIT